MSFFFLKIKNGNKRTIVILSLIKFSYYRNYNNSLNYETGADVKQANPSLSDIYNEAFYEGQARKSYHSAKSIIDALNTFIPKIGSVLDVGCGVGTWLKAWKEKYPESEIQGIDCNEISEQFLYIKRSFIDIKNLEALSSLEDSYCKYDLVESLEVGEHLPESSAEQYVNFLCNHGDLILFSAALPKQTGDHHINEQFPEYWNQLFQKNGFVCFDFLRQIIWNETSISWWYRQNILVFAKGDMVNKLKNRGLTPCTTVNALYHPELVKMHLQ